jgi:hypothetical protein
MVVGVAPYRTPQMVTTLDTAATLPDRLKRYRDAILRSPSPRQHYRVRGMDRSLGAIIDRCIAKRAEDRFENVQQVLEAIKRRSVQRMRQPLMLLGIVGPILLLLVMGVFSWRGIRTAERESSQQLREWALRSNEFAAKFASRTLETEMSGLFRLLEEEARNPGLLDTYKTFRDEFGTDTLDSLASVVTPESTRAKLLQSQGRKLVEQHLIQRLSRFQPSATGETQSVKFSSLFLTDEHGTQLALAIAEPSENVVGRNFAFRSYFNGMRQDLPQDTERLSIQPVERTHISAPYQSTSTGRWKIAVTLPVRFEGDQGSVVVGVLGLSINIGDFELLADNQSLDPKAARRIAVLVDGHDAQQGGTLVQHPVLTKLSGKQKFQIDPKQFEGLKKQGLFNYRDPIAEHKDGVGFRGEWIAAMQQVNVSRLPTESAESVREETDLWVLVQEPAETVTSPVYSLASKLFREGIIGLMSVIAVVCMLWFFVLYVIRIPDMPRVTTGTSNPQDGQSTEDITLTVE